MSHKSSRMQGETSQYLRLLEEPDEVKRNRTFLLGGEVAAANTVTANTIARLNSHRKGKSKGKEKGSHQTGTFAVQELRAKSSIFTPSNIPPGMKFISPDNQPYTVVQSVQTANFFVTSVAINVYAAATFILGDLDSAASLEAVFDQYRFNWVEIWINRAITTPGENYGFLYSVIDYDDANVLTTVPQAADYTNVLMAPGQDSHYHKFQPHCAVATYAGAFTSYGNVSGMWIDCGSPNVQHYGIKTAITTNTTATQYTLTKRYSISFRNVR